MHTSVACRDKPRRHTNTRIVARRALRATGDGNDSSLFRGNNVIMMGHLDCARMFRLCPLKFALTAVQNKELSKKQNSTENWDLIAGRLIGIIVLLYCNYF